MKPMYKSIHIRDLRLSHENPRYSSVSSEKEAVNLIISEQQNKLLKLAEDIKNNGLNPSELIIVTPNIHDKEKYDILEGNRRIAAIKLMENPSLIPESHKSIYLSFKQLAFYFKDNPIHEINCIVFQKKEEAKHWIKLKHTGQNSGAGTVEWNALQKQRFEATDNTPPNYASQIIDFLECSDLFPEDLKPKLNEIQSSTLQRLISDKDVKNALGIYSKGKKLYSDLSPSELIKPLTKITKDILEPSFTVKNIYYKNDKLNYLESFKKKELPDKSNNLNYNWFLNNTKVMHEIKKPKKKKTKRPKVKRNSIIPKGTLIPISSKSNYKRINNIFDELKDLDLSNFENAAAITFRVFLELSVDCYLEKNHTDNKVNPNLSLTQKMDLIIKDFEKNKLLEKDKLKPAKTTLSSPNSVFSINTLNAFVHNKNIHPNQNDLKNSWDNLELFFTELWASI